ncbi:ATP-dependent DNA helicase PIF1 [Trichonephila clavipes]|nr:ATP-dependent DNA helicase PIF1 [Trichonephila clavipes]
MTETRVLLPLPKDDGRKNGLQTRATKLRKLLEKKNYETLEYSCAAYVVEYVNKSNRGIRNLHQELIKIQEQNPEKEYVEIMKLLRVKFLNTVEMSSQEVAWYLLRQPMSRSSREMSYIPTVWPQERHKLRKRKAVMDEENLDGNSTDIWTKTSTGQRTIRVHLDNCSVYHKRSAPRVIRYRGYELNDVVNYKREMITLYLPFKNEAVEILDRDGFLRMYDEREAEIIAKRKEFESNIDIAKLLDEYKKICEDFDNVDPLDTSKNDFVQNVLGPGGTENNDDFENAVNTIGISAVRKRSNVMSKQEYCHMMRSTNNGQRELILETIHRLHLSDSIPIQIFFTGPAGSGKTYVLKLLMETYNRYTQQHNSLRNAFVACASTGKAAVNLGGVTVHSAFKITQSRRIGTMAREVLQNYRSTFIGVKCIIIVEVSMIGCDVLHKINLRLQEITGVHDQPFGNLNIIFCGDLHQLPPVNASPVY